MLQTVASPNIAYPTLLRRAPHAPMSPNRDATSARITPQSRSVRAQLKAQGVAVPRNIVRNVVCNWSKPFLAVCNSFAASMLKLRGFHHHTVQTPEGPMHAMSCKGTGKLPTVVVLPGLGTRVSDYGLLLWRLKSRFKRVVAIDLPSHGASQLRVPVDSGSFARAILHTKQTLAPEPVFMLGHSLGALGTMKSYLLMHPSQVLGMALVTPPGAPTAPDVVKNYTEKFDIRRWRDAQKIADMTDPRTCWPHIFTPAIMALRLTQAPIRKLLLSDVLTTHITPQNLATLPRHTMFVWAGREALLPDDYRRYFMRHLPATTTIFEPKDMAHGQIAWGQSKYFKPIMHFFKEATRDLERQGKLPVRLAPGMGPARKTRLTRNVRVVS